MYIRWPWEKLIDFRYFAHSDIMPVHSDYTDIACMSLSPEVVAKLHHNLTALQEGVKDGTHPEGRMFTFASGLALDDENMLYCSLQIGDTLQNRFLDCIEAVCPGMAVDVCSLSPKFLLGQKAIDIIIPTFETDMSSVTSKQFLACSVSICVLDNPEIPDITISLNNYDDDDT